VDIVRNKKHVRFNLVEVMGTWARDEEVMTPRPVSILYGKRPIIITASKEYEIKMSEGDV
jgi:hypothetical protein